MDGKDLIASASDLQSFYEQHQQQHHHRPSPLGGHSPSSHQQQQQQLAGMHSIIRPMPNMNMSATAILNSIGGMHQFHQMDPTTPTPSLLHNNSSNNNNLGSVSGPPAPPPPAEPAVKRKRGRPRKYGPDGTMKASSSSSSSAAAAQAQQHQHQQLVTAPPRTTTMGSLSGDMVGIEDPAAQKKRRGRPPGTGKKPGHLSPPPGNNAFSGTAGTSFTPHIITASPSEDVAAKIVAFANQSSKAVCVLSAMGSVSRVVLRHTADGSSPIIMSSRVHASAAPPPYNNNTAAIYEGLYEILSLSGSYSLREGEQSGGLRVTLCSPERNVIGGVLAGPLVAASTVQVVLGSFHQGGSRPKSSKKEKSAGKQQQQQAFSSDPLTGASPSSAGGGHNQNLTPPSVTTAAGWPSSGVFDTRSSSIDINSSRA